MRRAFRRGIAGRIPGFAGNLRWIEIDGRRRPPGAPGIRCQRGIYRLFFGFLAGRRVIATRLFVSTSDVGPGEVMPFYAMPTLGGNDTLRGFREYRFRGPHAMLAQAEYRWEIWSGLDGALFYDAGKVTNSRADLSFKDLENDYGFGFRFNTDDAIIFRVDAGFGSSDGKHLYIVFGGTF